MRALAYFKKGDIHFTNDIPRPEIQTDDEVIIDVSWCGICGSDLHEYLDGPIFMPKDGECHKLSNAALPLAMGHEMSGIVSKVGPKVTKVKVGDHVVLMLPAVVQTCIAGHTPNFTIPSHAMLVRGAVKIYVPTPVLWG